MPYKRKRQPVRRRARRTTKSTKKYTRRTRGPRKYARRSSRSLHSKSTGGTIRYSRPMTPFERMTHRKYQTYQTEFYQHVENGQIVVDSSNNMQNIETKYIYPYDDFNNAYTLWGNSFGASPDQQNTQKFFHLGCFADMRLKNSSNCMAEVDVYICNPKEDLPTGSGPGACWSAGLGDEQYVVTAPNSSTPYSSPFQSIAFSTNWRCKKVYHIEMMPGQNKRLQFNIKQGKVVGSSELTGQYDSSFYYRKYTTAIMIVARGTPTSSTTLITGDQYKVGLSPVRIDYTFNKQYSWKAFSAIPAFFGYTAPVSGWAAPSAETTYNIGSGASVTPAAI